MELSLTSEDKKSHNAESGHISEVLEKWLRVGDEIDYRHLQREYRKKRKSVARPQLS